MCTQSPAAAATVITRRAKHSKPHSVPHCMVLPPGKLNEINHPTASGQFYLYENNMQMAMPLTCHEQE